MLIEVKVPQLSESVSEATLLAWHKKQGEAVKRDENLIDIETDKVVLELPSPADGVLVSILKGDKSTVTAGELIAKIDTEGKAVAGASPVAGGAAPPAGTVTVCGSGRVTAGSTSALAITSIGRLVPLRRVKVAPYSSPERTRGGTPE